MKHLLIAILTLLLLSACKEEPSPLIAGVVSYKAENNTLVNKSLSKPQLQALSVWLVRSSSNWQRCFVTPPDNLLRVTLEHADGSTSSLSQLNFKNTHNTLMAEHLNGSNLNNQPCALQSFSQKEINSLHSILDVSL